jgi:hypothetical protein
MTLSRSAFELPRHVGGAEETRTLVSTDNFVGIRSIEQLAANLELRAAGNSTPGDLSLIGCLLTHEVGSVSPIAPLGHVEPEAGFEPAWQPLIDLGFSLSLLLRVGRYTRTSNSGNTLSDAAAVLWVRSRTVEGGRSRDEMARCG